MVGGREATGICMTPQSVKSYLSRPAPDSSIADVPEVAAELSGPDVNARGQLLAIGYLDAPRVFETVYPLLMIAAPSYLARTAWSRAAATCPFFRRCPPSVVIFVPASRRYGGLNWGLSSPVAAACRASGWPRR